MRSSDFGIGCNLEVLMHWGNVASSKDLLIIFFSGWEIWFFIPLMMIGGILSGPEDSLGFMVFMIVSTSSAVVCLKEKMFVGLFVFFISCSAVVFVFGIDSANSGAKLM